MNLKIEFMNDDEPLNLYHIICASRCEMALNKHSMEVFDIVTFTYPRSVCFLQDICVEYSNIKKCTAYNLMTRDMDIPVKNRLEYILGDKFCLEGDYRAEDHTNMSDDSRIFIHRKI